MRANVSREGKAPSEPGHPAGPLLVHKRDERKRDCPKRVFERVDCPFFASTTPKTNPERRRVCPILAAPEKIPYNFSFTSVTTSLIIRATGIPADSNFSILEAAVSSSPPTIAPA